MCARIQARAQKEYYLVIASSSMTSSSETSRSDSFSEVVGRKSAAVFGRSLTSARSMPRDLRARDEVWFGLGTDGGLGE